MLRPLFSAGGTMNPATMNPATRGTMHSENRGTMNSSRLSLEELERARALCAQVHAGPVAAVSNENIALLPNLFLLSADDAERQAKNRKVVIDAFESTLQKTWRGWVGECCKHTRTTHTCAHPHCGDLNLTCCFQI